MKAVVVRVVVAVKDFVVAHPELVVGLAAGIVIGLYV